ncbi:hypothetical protein SAMN05660657_05725 [Geodermatophilus amargosae]|uniref:Uncharacterized protein n=1 Tax=Geodermatophilus amargosae TaxID=1296565 RepID=A0A1I7DFS5_9ACTN|nr:hypothetical protein SAMN05660657_05725 [Geodermatophilus amargosae]
MSPPTATDGRCLDTAPKAEPDIVATGPLDNSAIAFAYRGVARPQFLSGDADKITWVTVTGTVSCPAPLPDLTWGDG